MSQKHLSNLPKDKNLTVVPFILIPEYKVNQTRPKITGMGSLAIQLPLTASGSQAPEEFAS